MSDASPEPETPEVRTIRQLVRLMQRFDLTAIDLGDGPGRIRLRRRGAEVVGPAVAASPAAYAPPVAVPAMAAPAAAAPPASAPEKPKGLFIESPMVGTFYSSSSPETPPFVSVGSTIRHESTVCIIEAMKVFTDIPAGHAGTITEVLVKNGQAVEFGQPLFRVEPA
jgi:acetyl-CoA carboxylase biotin carboxyl carrier protein